MKISGSRAVFSKMDIAMTICLIVFTTVSYFLPERKQVMNLFYATVALPVALSLHRMNWRELWNNTAFRILVVFAGYMSVSVFWGEKDWGDMKYPLYAVVFALSIIQVIRSGILTWRQLYWIATLGVSVYCCYLLCNYQDYKVGGRMIGIGMFAEPTLFGILCFQFALFGVVEIARRREQGADQASHELRPDKERGSGPLRCLCETGSQSADSSKEENDCPRMTRMSADEGNGCPRKDAKEREKTLDIWFSKFRAFFASFSGQKYSYRSRSLGISALLQLLGAITIAPLLTCGFLANSRGPLMAFILGLTAYILYRLWAKKVLFVSFIIISACLAFGAWQKIRAGSQKSEAGSPGEKTLASHRLVERGLNADARLKIWKHTVFTEFPRFWGFGGGIDRKWNLIGHDHPHNIFLGITLRGGLIGILLFSTFVILVLFRGQFPPHPSSELRPLNSVLFPLLAVFVHCCTDEYRFFTRPDRVWFYLMLPLFVLMAEAIRRRRTAGSRELEAGSRESSDSVATESLKCFAEHSGAKDFTSVAGESSHEEAQRTQKKDDSSAKQTNMWFLRFFAANKGIAFLLLLTIACIWKAASAWNAVPEYVTIGKQINAYFDRNMIREPYVFNATGDKRIASYCTIKGVKNIPESEATRSFFYYHIGMSSNYPMGIAVILPKDREDIMNILGEKYSDISKLGKLYTLVTSSNKENTLWYLPSNGKSTQIVNEQFTDSNLKNYWTGGYYLANNAIIIKGLRPVIFSQLIVIKSGYIYRLSGRIRSGGPSNNRLYLGFIPYNKDKKQITHQSVHPCGKQTVLAKPCQKTDTVLYVRDASDWIIYEYAFVAFDVDKTGPFSDLPNFNLSQAGVNSVQRAKSEVHGDEFWEVKLAKPCGKAYPAGTPVRQHKAGGTYMYTAALNVEVPNEWTEYSGIVYEQSKYWVSDNFWWPGTKYVKIVVLANWDTPEKAKDQVLEVDWIRLEEFGPRIDTDEHR